MYLLRAILFFEHASNAWFAFAAALQTYAKDPVVTGCRGGTPDRGPGAGAPSSASKRWLCIKRTEGYRRAV